MIVRYGLLILLERKESRITGYIVSFETLDKEFTFMARLTEKGSRSESKIGAACKADGCESAQVMRVRPESA